MGRGEIIAVAREYDIVVSCGGGYPLDTTLYQTIKGMVFATPFVKTGKGEGRWKR